MLADDIRPATPRHLPDARIGLPELRFSAADQRRMFAREGANCGPGAIAAVAGVTLETALAALPEFPARRATTEVMARQALIALGLRIRVLRDALSGIGADPVGPGRISDQEDGPDLEASEQESHDHDTGDHDRGRAWPNFGLIRVAWDGPWRNSPDRFEPLRHSHWIGTVRDPLHGTRWVFDINAIAVGGWISLDEWHGTLRPWLLQSAEPRATGAWSIVDAIEILPGLC